MSKLYPNPHGAGCPWFEWAESFGASAFHYCEPTVCAVVSEPANTYSNLFYFLAAGFVLARPAVEKKWHLRFFGWSLAGIGLCSTLYHAANIWPLQFLDFVGMYLSILFVVTLGLVENKIISKAKFWKFYGGSFLCFSALTIAFYYLGVNFRYNVGLIAVGILGLETYYWQKGAPGRYLLFLSAMALVGAGNVLSSMDLQRYWCNPASQWLFGHAIWHLLSALGLAISILHWERAYHVDPLQD